MAPGGGEQATVRAILQFLHAHRIPAWRMNSGGFRAEYKGTTRFHRFGVTGMSDILGALVCRHGPDHTDHNCDHGRLLSIEVKSATGKVSAAQKDFLAQVTGAGGKAFVARDVATVARELGL